MSLSKAAKLFLLSLFKYVSLAYGHLFFPFAQTICKILPSLHFYQDERLNIFDLFMRNEIFPSVRIISRIRLYHFPTP